MRNITVILTKQGNTMRKPTTDEKIIAFITSLRSKTSYFRMHKIQQH